MYVTQVEEKIVILQVHLDIIKMMQIPLLHGVLIMLKSIGVAIISQIQLNNIHNSQML